MSSISWSPASRKIGCTIIAFTGVKDSTLARHSDLVIDVGVAKEACPMGIVPTASTTPPCWPWAMRWL